MVLNFHFHGAYLTSIGLGGEPISTIFCGIGSGSGSHFMQTKDKNDGFHFHFHFPPLNSIQPNDPLGFSNSTLGTIICTL